MSRRPQLSRQVPRESVRMFADWCERKGHVNGGDKGRQAETAIIEYLPPDYRPSRFRDDLGELEADLRADLSEVGQFNDDSSLNEILTSNPADETVKLTYRVAEDVQNSLEQYVYDLEEKVRGVIGEHVAAALNEYRDGGQVARVRRYYEQLRESVDMISEDRVGTVVETLTNNTADRDYYNIKEIEYAVDEALDVHSNDVKHDYAERVIERLGFVAVETSDGVFAAPEQAEQLVQEHEVDFDLNWHLLDKEDRVEYLTEAVKARSRQTTSGAGVDYNQARDEIFEGHPSNDYCYELMKLGGEYSGFTYGEHNGKKMLRYTGWNDLLSAQSDNEWLDDATMLVQEFCDSAGMKPTQIDQPVLNNKIAQAKFPEEYDNDHGPSEQAMQKVTGDDRTCVLDSLTESSDHAESQVEDEFEQLTTKAEFVTDGGQ